MLPLLPASLLAQALPSSHSSQVTADVAFSSATTIEPVGAAQIALSHVHENKKGGSKDSYLLEASTAASRDAWVAAFKALHQLACAAGPSISTPPQSPGVGAGSSPQVQHRCACACSSAT